MIYRLQYRSWRAKSWRIVSTYFTTFEHAKQLAMHRKDRSDKIGEHGQWRLVTSDDEQVWIEPELYDLDNSKQVLDLQAELERLKNA